MYNEFKDIFQYLVSVRKLKNYLSIDIEFPEHWKIPKKYAQEDKIIENDRLKDGLRFFSFVCEFEEMTVNNTVNSIKNIIIYNKEIEMKERLLKQKIEELKKIFQQEKYENLQALRFDILEENLNDGEEIVDTGRERIGLVEE